MIRRGTGTKSGELQPHWKRPIVEPLHPVFVRNQNRSRFWGDSNGPGNTDRSRGDHSRSDSTDGDHIGDRTDVPIQGVDRDSNGDDPSADSGGGPTCLLLARHSQSRQFSLLVELREVRRLPFRRNQLSRPTAEPRKVLKSTFSSFPPIEACASEAFITLSPATESQFRSQELTINNGLTPVTGSMVSINCYITLLQGVKDG